MFRTISIFAFLLSACVGFSTAASAASVSLSDAMRDFSDQEATLSAPLAGEEVPDTDQSVLNIGDTPVIQSPQADNMDLPFQDLQQNLFQLNDNNLLGQTERMMNEDGSTAIIPFQL